MTPDQRAQLRAFSARMWSEWHYGDDKYRAERCKTLHEQCQRMLKGDESPEIKRAFKASLDDLKRYDDGAYNHLIGILQ